MYLILETTTGLLVPGGVAPSLSRGGLKPAFLQFVTNGVAALLAGGAPIALKLYLPADLVTPIATFGAWATSAADVGYTAQLDTLSGGLAALERGTLIAKISYAEPNVNSQNFQVRYGVGSSGVGAVLQIVLPQPVGMSVLSKADASTPCLLKTGNGTLALKAGTAVAVGGLLLTFAGQTAVEMPALVAGADYAVYVTTDGRVIASSNFGAPAGYTTANSLKIGGFHYAPGGAAAAQAGGDATPQIFASSIWDLKFRPAADDPRGLSLVPGAGWVGLYPLNTTPHLLGVSAYGAQIADGGSLPVIPLQVGGNGAATYPDFSRFIAEELLGAFGFNLLTPAQRALAAYGTTEATQRGADPVTTGLDAPRTSKYIFQASGNMWEWMAGETVNAVAVVAAFAWRATPQGRGQIHESALCAPIGGGSWGNGASCGSRCASWDDSPWNSYSYIGARARCDHLSLV